MKESDLMWRVAFGTFLFGLCVYGALVSVVIILKLGFQLQISGEYLIIIFILSFFIGWIITVISEWDDIKGIKE